MLFGTGLHKFNIKLQSIRGKIAQVTMNGEPVANSKVEEALGDVNLSLDQLQK